MSARGEVRVQVAGTELVLLPERAAWWPATQTLFVADAHWGKAASFRAGGVAAPHGTTAGGLARLDAVLARHAASRIVFLGDFLHAREGRAPRTLERLAAWRSAHPALQLVLVRGNHDRQAGDPPPDLEIGCVDEPFTDGPFALAHHPGTRATGYVLAGHLHPGVRLAGAGGERTRLPCFWFQAHEAVLPAFGEFTGLADITPAPGDRVLVVAGDEVVPVGGSEARGQA